MPASELTIVVPVYNEQDSLFRLKAETDKFLASNTLITNVLFVNDGSTDSSLEKIKKICQSDETYAYISLDQNRGLSTAIKAGIDHARSKWIGYLDADLQTSPSDFSLLLPYMHQYDLVIGYRHNRKDKFIKRVSSLIANSFRRRVLVDGVKDTGCPLKILKTDVARKIPFYTGMHRFIPALVQIQGGTVKEIPVRHFQRIEGQAKYHLGNRIIKPFLDTLAVYWIKKRNISYHIIEKSPEK